MRSDSLTNLLFIVLPAFLLFSHPALAQTKVQGNVSINVISATNVAIISDEDVAKIPDSSASAPEMTGTETRLVRTASTDPDTGSAETEITLMY